VTAVFLQGDSRTVLKGLPADWIHCCVTSPPYYGLRKYDGGEEIWGGDPNCEHQWGSILPRIGNEYREDKGSYKDVPVRSGVARVNEATSGSFCSLCSAWKGQLGAEPSPELFVQHLIQVMREVRRVLRPDGIFWINIGDSWAGNMSVGSSGTRAGFDIPRDGTIKRGGDSIKPLDMILIPQQLALAARADGWYVRSIPIWVKTNPMPMSVNGWRWERCKVSQCPNCKSYSSFRNRVCKECGWEKPANRGFGEGPNTGSNNKEPYQGNNPHVLRLQGEPWRSETGQQEHNEDGGFRSDSFMVDCPGCPKCSSNNGLVLRKGSWRPTNSYEFILMLTKTDNYYCDKQAVVEPITGSTKKRVKTGLRHTHPADVGVGIPPVDTDVMGQRFGPDGGRNLRSVWEFPTTPGKFQHYAAFPPRLPEICIKVSTSEKGCCPRCGAPYARVINRERQREGGTPLTRDIGIAGSTALASLPSDLRIDSSKSGMGTPIIKTIGWRPTCSCDIGDLPPSPVPCRVLDPMCGAGTTSLAAERLGVDSIGIDTSAKYIEISKERLNQENEKIGRVKD